MDDSKDSRLQQISASVAALAGSVPALLHGDLGTAAVALGGVGFLSVVENIRARGRKLDELVSVVLADPRLQERFDATVKPDEFIALYVRAKDTAAKSEKEEKLRYIRNFLVNALVLPGSAEPDKERYLRLIDELSAREHEHLIGFLQMTIPSSGRPTVADYLRQPATAGGAIRTYACRVLGEQESSSSARVNDLTDELVVAFRHMDSVGLLDAIATRAGEPSFHFQTNGFTPKFLQFILEPF